MSCFMRPLSMRLLALVAGVQLAACVSPPIGREPSPSADLKSVLTGGRDLPVEQLARSLRALSLEHPRHVPTLVADAALCLETGRVGRATALLDAALQLAPDHGDAVLLATKVAARSGDLGSAWRRVNAALRTRPDAPELHEASAALHFLEEQYGESLAALDRADALAGEASWRSSYHRGLVAEAQGNLTAARDYFLQCEDDASAFEPAVRRRRWIESQMAESPR